MRMRERIWRWLRGGMDAGRGPFILVIRPMGTVGGPPSASVAKAPLPGVGVCVATAGRSISQPQGLSREVRGSAMPAAPVTPTTPASATGDRPAAPRPATQRPHRQQAPASARSSLQRRPAPALRRGGPTTGLVGWPPILAELRDPIWSGHTEHTALQHAARVAAQKNGAWGKDGGEGKDGGRSDGWMAK